VSPFRDPVLWVLLALFVLMLAWHAFADATPLGAVTPGCVPGYWTMEPEGGATWAFSVDVTARGRLWRETYTYPNAPCCELVRRVVTEVVQRVRDPNAKVRVDESCR
jgi:hypothetical protein